MAQNATLSIIIGATVAGGFFGTFTDTKRLIQSIGNVSDEINKKQIVGAISDWYALRRMSSFSTNTSYIRCNALALIAPYGMDLEIDV